MIGFMGVYKSVRLPIVQSVARIIEPTVIGDGEADDTVAVQAALTTASNSGLTFQVPRNKVCRITAALFAWGAANLQSADSTASLKFDAPPDSPYLINFGISAKLVLAAVWTGNVTRLNMSVFSGVGSGSAGRVLYLWRASGNVIGSNILNVGAWPYSLTGSGNNSAYVASGSDCVRKNIIVSRNFVYAAQSAGGGEGVGINSYDGAQVYYNNVAGVGDDPIGIHFCTNFTVRSNTLTSVDGRIYCSNSQFGEIGANAHMRIASPVTGLASPGIALIYLGFESYTTPTGAAPESIWVHHNTLTYNAQTVDLGAALFIIGARSTTVEDNSVVNNAAGGSAFALHLQNADFPNSNWTDPSGRDPTTAAFPSTVLIQRNVASGTRPLGFLMTGPALDYIAPITVNNNTGASFSFYSPATQSGNVVTS